MSKRIMELQSVKASLWELLQDQLPNFLIKQTQKRKQTNKQIKWKGNLSPKKEERGVSTNGDMQILFETIKKFGDDYGTVGNVLLRKYFLRCGNAIGVII